MKKPFVALFCLLLMFSAIMTGCSASSATSAPAPTATWAETAPTPSAHAEALTAVEDGSDTGAGELSVRFGDGGEAFILHLEDNSTAETIAMYVGTTDWRLPVYSYDESDVMEYYDVPSRYEIPDNSQVVTEAHAGEVYYSDPNRIVLYYHDAEINEEYTLIGTFDATEEFVAAVENNPVLEGWGNQIIVISDGE